MNHLVNAWYQKSPLLYLLLPIALIYQLIVKFKRKFYLSGCKKQVRFPVPIIVVGNITVGGTGKTPLIIALTHLLCANGYRPGIVSRGYGGKAQVLPLLVTSNTKPEQAGDESVLIARKTNCPVIVSPKRVTAVEKLLNDHHCDIILSDDGLQHYALYRDIEIAVIDGQRRFGNQLCLPAGPLREPISRLNSVDFIVTQGKAAQGEWRMQLAADDLYCLIDAKHKMDLKQVQNKPIHAIAGIGNPLRFFQQLASLGFTVIAHPFPDHYIYKPKDIYFDDDNLVIMTEKDAVKCETFADTRHWCLPVNASYDPLFGRLLLEKLKTIVDNVACDKM